ncbi:MAG: extracellular solute-binding protein, partial [Oscillospiraceae bacterium]
GKEGDDYISIMTQLNTKIMAGKGPDLFWLPQDVADSYKIMESGALADMTSYFENDENFNIDDFNKNVFYGGQQMGKQYVVPLNYSIPLLLTTKNIVSETGFDVSKCTNFFTCGKEIARVAKENKLKCKENEICNFLFIPYYWQLNSGVNWMNYEKDIVSIDTPEIKKIYEMLKSDMLPILHSRDGSYPPRTVLGAHSFIQKKTMFADVTNYGFLRLSELIKAIIAKDEEPVIIPWRNVNGKIQATAYDSVAVLGNSENKQNAYNFIKLLMSPEFSAEYYKNQNSFFLGMFPINNTVATDYFKFNSNAQKVYFDGEGIRDMSQMSESYIDQLMGYGSEVVGMSMYSKAIYDFNKIMQPYLDGTKSYEKCIENAKEQFEIYVTE